LGELFVSEADEIASRDTDACYAFFFSETNRSIDLSKYVSFPTAEREFVIISDLVETGATNNPKRISTDQEVSQLQKVIYERLDQRYSTSELLVIANPHSPKYSHQTVCRMFRARLEEVLNLPVTDRAQLLRFLFGGASANKHNRDTPDSAGRA